MENEHVWCRNNPLSGKYRNREHGWKIAQQLSSMLKAEMDPEPISVQHLNTLLVYNLQYSTMIGGSA